MPTKVEKYKLSPEQLDFAKKFKQIGKLKQVLEQGIQYKASELEQLQRLATGMDMRIAQILKQAPTELDEVSEQIDPSQLVINY